MTYQQINKSQFVASGLSTATVEFKTDKTFSVLIDFLLPAQIPDYLRR